MAWHSVAKADDLGDDEVIGVEVEGREIAVYNLGGVYYATHNICTHEYACLSDGYIEGDCKSNARSTRAISTSPPARRRARPSSRISRSIP